MANQSLSAQIDTLSLSPCISWLGERTPLLAVRTRLLAVGHVVQPTQHASLAAPPPSTLHPNPSPPYAQVLATA